MEWRNWLPRDGMAHYLGNILDGRAADCYLDRLLQTIAWQHDEIVMFGKRIVTKREVAWYGDQPYSYKYSHVSKEALPWTPELRALKALVEAGSGETYNSCLLNLYHDGGEGMGWHSDAEPELKKDGAIASLSLGAGRRFLFKHRISGEKVELHLEHGSLLVMKGVTQTFWLHSLPVSKRVSVPRVNLTFRTIGG